MSKYGGVPVESGSKYGGVPITEKQAQDALHSHPAYQDDPIALAKAEAAKRYNLPLENIDMEKGSAYIDRLRVGLGADTATERFKTVSKHHLKDNVQNVEVGNNTYTFVRPEGSDRAYIVNPPGGDFGDIPEFLGQEGPSAVPAILSTIIGNPAPAIGYAAKAGRLFTGGPGRAAMSGEMVRQGGQTLVGTQDQSLVDQGKEVAIKAALEGGGAALMSRNANTLNFLGGRGAVAEPALRRDLQNIYNLKKLDSDSYIEVPALADILDNRVWDRFESQSRAAIASVDRKLQQIAQSGKKEAINKLLDTRKEISGKYLEAVTKKELALEKRKVMGRMNRPSREKVGTQINEAATKWNEDTQKVIDKEWKHTDYFAGKEEPIFDLRPASQYMENKKVYGTTSETVEDTLPSGAIIGTDGKPLIQEEDVLSYVQGRLNVAATPQAKIRTVVDLMDKLDPIQANYQVIKELRTQVGDTLNLFPFDEKTQIKHARGLYGKLSNVLLNPVNKGTTKKFVKQIERSIAKSKEKFDATTRNPDVAAIFQGEFVPARMAKTFVEDPASLNPHVRQIIDADPVAKRDLRFSIFRDAMDSGKDPKLYMEELSRGNRDAVQWLMKGRSVTESFAHARRGMLRINQSSVQKTLKENLPAVEFNQRLLANTKGPEQVTYLLRQVGGNGSEGHRSLRIALMDDIITSSVKTNKGVQYLDSNVLSQRINDLKDPNNGMWGLILNKDDKIRLEGINSMLRVTANKSKDAGTSLETAQMISQLKHPATFVLGLHKLAVNKGIGWVMTNPSLRNSYFLARIGKGGRLDESSIRQLGVILGSTADYINESAR